VKKSCVPVSSFAVVLLVGLSVAATAGPVHARPLVVEDGLHPVGPPLTALQAKVTNADWIVAWLLKPNRLRLNQHMSKLRITPEEARAVAAHLYSGPPPHSGPPPPTPSVQWKGGDARKGEQLFAARGCRGCHTIGATTPPAWTRAPDLAGIGIKVRGDWLFNWIKSPRTYNPDTAMPQLTLNDGEIRDLVAFLLSHREGAEVVVAVTKRKTGSATEAVGAIMSRFDCPKCHVMKDALAVAAPLDWTAPPRACTACHEPRSAPRMTSATAAPPEPPGPVVEGRRLVTYYNCRGCHRLDGNGGAIAEHLERKTFAPPTLDGEGARVQPSWLVEFLQHPKTLRPWLDIRMPDFGMTPAEAQVLAQCFAALARVQPADEPFASAADDVVALGRRRLLHYKCLQCHPATHEPVLPEGVDLEDLSINLTLTRTRLRPSWVREFLARPKAVMGMATRMPTVFYDTDGVPKVEHPERDITAITAYLGQMTEVPPESERAPTAAPTPIDWATQPY